MTARDIQRRLLVERYRRSFVLHNYTPRGWFECDVFEVTEAGIFVEYEIKLTAADFEADKLKQMEGWRYDSASGRGETFVIGNKHQMLASHATAGPSRFWFVLAAQKINNGTLGIVPTSRVPEWAGVMHAVETPRRRFHYSCSISIVRNAPQLHREKTGQTYLKHSESVCYYRMHNLFIHGKLEDDERC